MTAPANPHPFEPARSVGTRSPSGDPAHLTTFIGMMRESCRVEPCPAGAPRMRPGLIRSLHNYPFG